MDSMTMRLARSLREQGFSDSHASKMAEIFEENMYEAGYLYDGGTDRVIACSCGAFGVDHKGYCLGYEGPTTFLDRLLKRS